MKKHELIINQKSSIITMEKHYASVSFGKDSLAMLLMLIEHNDPIDEVVFYDTGMEFKAIYDTRDTILPMLAKLGIRYTELKPKVPFETKMFDITVHNKQGGTHSGYSWCGGTCRWGTSDKLAALKKHIGNGVDYVGIASDEVKRINKEKRSGKLLPLVEWGVTEKMALEYCYKKGFKWVESGIELYTVLDRVSCWCCGNKNNGELLRMHKYLPEYFKMLKHFESRNRLNFRGSGRDSIFDIEQKILNGTLIFRKNKE